MGGKHNDPGLVNTLLGLLKCFDDYSEENYHQFYAAAAGMFLDKTLTLRRIISEIDEGAFEYHPKQHLFAARCAAELDDDEYLSRSLEQAYKDNDYELAVIAANHIDLKRNEILDYADFIFSYDPGEALKHYIRAKRRIGFNREINRALDERLDQLCGDYHAQLLNGTGREDAKKTLKNIIQYFQSIRKQEESSLFYLSMILEAKSIPYLFDLYETVENTILKKYKDTLYTRYINRIRVLLPNCESIDDLYQLPDIPGNYELWTQQLSDQQEKKYIKWGFKALQGNRRPDMRVSALCFRLAGKKGHGTANKIVSIYADSLSRRSNIFLCRKDLRILPDEAYEIGMQELEKELKKHHPLSLGLIPPNLERF